MKNLILFGSGSDEPIYGEIAKALKAGKIEIETRVASAHRTPELVEKIVAKKWSSIFAGAGVSAALPGVVAALTIRPVFGIPVDGALDGLDAFLSILQMPPGIPVICCPPGKQAISLIKKHRTFFKKIGDGKLNGVNIIGEAENPRVLEAIDLLSTNNIPVMISNTTEPTAVNIHIFKGTKPKLKDTKEPLICVPLIKNSKALDALKIMKASKGYFWVGINRVDNAVLAAISILSHKGKYDSLIKSARLAGAKKVKKSDSATRRKYG